jgi:RNA polymerase sigma factor, sigma-70 family
MLAHLDRNPSEGIKLLIDCYSALVYHIVYGKLGKVFSSDDIEEFVGFVFSKIYEKRGEIDFSRGTLKGYIATVAARMSIDEYRRQVSRIRTEPLTDEMADDASGERNMQEKVEQTIDEKALIGALKRLGAKDRDLLIRRYYYNQSSVQIAGEWHMSDAAVRMRISRALKKLRQLLSENDFYCD